MMATWISVKDFFRDDGPYWSGSIAFYTVLSSLPLALLLVLAASLAVDSDSAVELVSGIAGDLLPQGEARIREIVEASYNGRGVAGFFSILVLLWSGGHVFGAISRALNVAYNVPARRPIWSQMLMQFAMLAVVGTLLLVLAASLAVDSDSAVELVSGIAGDLLPQGEARIREIVEASYNGRGVAGFFSILVLLWSGGHVFGAISRALNVAYNVPARRPIWSQMLMQFAMLAVVGTLLILGLLSRTLIDVIWTIRDIGEDERTAAYSILRNGLPFLFTVLAFFLVYRFVPQRKPEWKTAAVGAVLASLAFFIARDVFLLYQTMTGGFDRVYGPITLLVALLFWIWIAGVILLVGGQLVAHYQEILVDGEAPEAVEARHVDAKMLRTRPEG